MSLAELTSHHLRIADSRFREAVEFADAGDVSSLAAHLAGHPGLIHERVSFPEDRYFRRPSLLEFVPENPVRNGLLPANVVEVAELLLEAGAQHDAEMVTGALLLTATGRVAREQGKQLDLIDLFCNRGGDLNAAIRPALAHGERDAANRLAELGATVSLPVGAGLGRVADVEHLLPGADPAGKHEALALAVQSGHVEVVKLLLAAGVGPNRYNPSGMHEHSVPLHQAAWQGNLELVELLVRFGADVSLRDKLWKGTAADWARHANHLDTARYLETGLA